jgi:hypothetical protein
MSEADTTQSNTTKTYKIYIYEQREGKPYGDPLAKSIVDAGDDGLVGNLTNRSLSLNNKEAGWHDLGSKRVVTLTTTETSASWTKDRPITEGDDLTGATLRIDV